MYIKMSNVLEQQFIKNLSKSDVQLKMVIDDCKDLLNDDFGITANASPKKLKLCLDGMLEANSAAWITPSPSPILCSPGSVKVLPKVQKKMSSNYEDCKSIYRSVPTVRHHFKVLRKIGSGTFSNVYLATLRAFGDKSPQYALKHIFSTSHPKRIANEIKCLNEIGGMNHVIGVESCIRYNGEVVIVMPYQKHSDFMDLLNKMTIEDVREYMRQLLTALFQVHKHSVIHRDVKPNNFLFDLETRQSGLVDFGLAQFFVSETPTKTDEKITTQENVHDSTKENNVNVAAEHLQNKTAEVFSRNDVIASPKAKRRCLGEIQLNSVSLRNLSKKPVEEKKKLINRKLPRAEQSCLAENVAFSKPNSTLHEKLQFLAVTSPKSLANRSSAPKRSSTITIADVFPSIRRYGRSVSEGSSSTKGKFRKEDKSCGCFGNLSVCCKCLARPAANASRAGTAGFRPPEVLLRYSDQTTAVDIWSAGVIFLTLLCGRCPFFRPSEDIDSLAQLILIFGSKKMQDLAKLLGRKLTCSQHFVGYDLRGIVMALKQPAQSEGPTLRASPKCRAVVEGKESPRKPLQNKPTGFDAVDIPDSAFDLLGRMLDPNPRTRITALRALYHDFLITDERKVFVTPSSSQKSGTY